MIKKFDASFLPHITDEEHNRQLQYYYKHREERKEYNRERGRKYYHNHKKERTKANRNNVLKRTFGITLSDYYKMVSHRGNTCDICHNPPSGRGGLHVDHCHKTGRIRGLLCSKCNQGLGLFSDNLSLLNKAIWYLQGD